MGQITRWIQTHGRLPNPIAGSVEEYMDIMRDYIKRMGRCNPMFPEDDKK